jgi:uncharacterized protein (UPF0335 family)
MASDSGAAGVTMPDVAADRLRSLVERIERLNEERQALGSDITDLYQEAKSAGFDTKALRRLIADRKLDPADLQTRDQLLAVYRRALGGLADTPLGTSALDRVARAASGETITGPQGGAVRKAVEKFHDMADQMGGAGSISIGSGGKTVQFGRKPRAAGSEGRA